MIDLESLRRQWLIERPIYEQLAQHVRDILESEARRRGIQCTVTARAKEMASLLKKVLRKRYERPYESVGDKAGVRITLAYPDTVDAAVEMVRGLFVVLKHEDKGLDLGHEKLGYLGIHIDVTVPDALAAPHEDRLRGKACEVQVHTGAQSLWAAVAHQLAYKPAQDPPPEILRAIYRLVSLVEIFDSEVGRARRALLKLQGFREARVLDELEKHFWQLTARSFDRALSLDIISKLLPALSPTDIEGFGDRMDRFVRAYGEKLREIFDAYRGDDRHLLLSQPESLLVFERLETNSFALREIWQAELPQELLDGLLDVWGADV